MASKARPGERIGSFRAFYPYYLSEHRDPVTRVLHFIGTGLIPFWMALALFDRNAWWLLGVPAAGYGLAWIGHFFFAHNKPATFRYPLWSLASDFVLFFELITGRRKFSGEQE
ncbi:MAG: DUF962 domain-containing protein [Flavobacteriales bacterium]|nr:DUF962 domain-containing protein [Flavobacteriales bacterium]MCB9167862.1 DUF962 domain-containing protein [Flavobacteriales bacterium]